uniref:Uncharacterized protein n=1 Tax=Micrurus lemniscatus lemniscatus TaxID=129467 RepID=A0A2D4J6J6_MICLE
MLSLGALARQRSVSGSKNPFWCAKQEFSLSMVFPGYFKKKEKKKNQGLVNCCTFVKACPICGLFGINVCCEAEFDLVKNQLDLEDLVSSFDSSQFGGPFVSQEGCTMFTFQYRYISFICFFLNLPQRGLFCAMHTIDFCITFAVVFPLVRIIALVLLLHSHLLCHVKPKKCPLHNG